jgi:hypothetical protein
MNLYNLCYMKQLSHLVAARHPLTLRCCCFLPLSL